MYGVVGTDGVVYGPVPVTTLYEWIAQGRIVPATELIDWQGRRLPASMAPELQGAFPVQTQPYATVFAAPVFYRPAKSRRTALWLAFLLGFLGAHRFYLGHTWTGLAMLALNVAVLRMDVGAACVLVVVAGVWLMADMARIASGSLKAADGSPLG